MVDNPQPAGATWLNTVVTDTVDSNLQILGLSTTQGYAGWADHDVTFTIGTMPPGCLAKLMIYVEVKGDAPQGYDVYNTAYLSHSGWPTVPSEPSHWMSRIAYQQNLPLAMKRQLLP